jgi:ATP-dependent Clp protease adaptor protein ClpS
MMIIAVIQAPEKASEKVRDRDAQLVRKPYPNFKVIVLNDDFNTFEHVSKCLVTYIPDMSEERAWELTNQVHFEGSAIAWVGPQEQAELYHAQLKQERLTMAPLEIV